MVSWPRTTAVRLAAIEIDFERILGERTRLRAESHTVLREITDPLERRFLYALLCYFLEHGTPYKDPEDMDVAIESLLAKGPGEVFDSPSFVMLQELATETDPMKMQQLVAKRRQELAGYFTTVTNAFVDLERSIRKK